MSASASAERSIWRRLFEEWNVPLDIIVKAAGKRGSTVRRYAKEENWQRGGELTASLNRIVALFEAQLDAINTSPLDGKDAEIAAKALSVLAKTLETIAAVSGRISQVSRNKTSEVDESNHARSLDCTAEGTMALDQRLTALVRGLRGSGSDQAGA